jgi:hypothetical protein
MFKEELYIRPAAGDGYNLDECMAGESWISKLNSVYTGFVRKHDFIVGCVNKCGEIHGWLTHLFPLPLGTVYHRPLRHTGH